MRYRTVFVAALCLSMAYLAASCAPSGPGPSDEDLAATSAFETLVALGVIQPQDSGPTATNTPQPEQSQDDLPPSRTPSPTATPTSTQEQDACIDQAIYGDDIDVTIPDDTEFAPGASAQKTWRIYNDGSCTWTSAYELVFAAGDQMGGPSLQAFPGSVAPDASLDISINITAPTTPGTYQGFWKLRNPQGMFLSGPTGNNVTLWVKIVVTDNPTGANASDIALFVVEPISGYVLSDGAIGAAENVGDLPGGVSMQAFMTWVISAIPAGSTIQEVEVDFSDSDTLGTPFADLQCLRAYAHDYGTLDSRDYISGSVTGSLARWCDIDDLQNPIISGAFLTALQDKVGSDHFQIRLQFSSIPSDGDADADVVRFNMAILRVRYTEP